MSGYGGGGGGKAVAAIVAVIVFIVALIVAFALFPKSVKNQLQFGAGGAASSTGGLPIAGALRPQEGRIPLRGTSGESAAEVPMTRSSSTFFMPVEVAPPPSARHGITPPAPAFSAATASLPAIQDSEIPAGFTRAQLSPYFRRVRLGSVYSGGYGAVGQISLSSAGISRDETVNVSGWRIQGNRGASYIPKAVAMYEPNGLTPETGIYLRNRDTLYLYLGGSSAIGKNFRLNRCMGYLPNADEFNPYLPRDCPVPPRSEYSSFTGQCQNYIASLGSCGIPDFNDVRMPQGDYACRAYLEKNFTYASCVERYRASAEFMKPEIRAWIGGGFLDQYHDKVKLFDQNGLLVDTYEY